jgi:outer membrane protein TolC
LVEELKNNRYRLATLTGQYPGQLIKNLKTENNDIPDYVARIPDNLPLSILRQRPDIIAAEARLRQATANIGIALADYYPDLDLTGSVTITTGGISGMDMLTSTIGAMIDQIIFDGGIRKADVKSARAQTDAALANYEQSLRLAAGEVEESLSAIQASLDRQASLERVIESSSRSFDQAETLYQQGLISFLDVVDAQRVLADGEQSLARERTNYATQIARLFEVLGLGHTKDMGSANS